MPTIDARLDQAGWTIPVILGLCSEDRDCRVAKGAAVPESLVTRGTIDTGAGMSGIRVSLLRRLGIEPAGKRVMLTAFGCLHDHEVDVYPIALGLVASGGPYGLHLMADTLVWGLPDGPDQIDVVLGRTTLEHCLLVFDGPAKRLTVAI